MVQTTVLVPWGAREADSKEARPEEKAGASIVVEVRGQEVRGLPVRHCQEPDPAPVSGDAGA